MSVFIETRKKRQGISSSPQPAVWKSSSCVLEDLSALPLVGRNCSKKQFDLFEVKTCTYIDFATVTTFCFSFLDIGDNMDIDLDEIGMYKYTS